MEPVRREAYAQRSRFIAPFIQSIPPRVLEVGAGYGAGVDVLEAMGYCVDAMLEPDPIKARYLRETKTGVVFQQTIQDFLKGNDIADRYDVIMLAHVFEHCNDPRLVLESLARLLTKDGIVYIEVPDLFQIVNWSDALYLAHHSNFALDTFVTFARSCGLEVVQSTRIRNEDDRDDMGFILRPLERRYQSTGPLAPQVARVEVVKQLYRKGLPPELVPLMDEPVLYRIPAIENFYYGLRFDRWTMVRQNDRSILFIPKT